MSTKNSGIYSRQISTIHAALPAGSDASAEIRYITSVYRCDGTEGAADVINVCNVPVGAVVLPAKSRVSAEACGGTAGTILTIGDSSDAARYMASGNAIAISAAAVSAAIVPVPASEVATVTGSDALLPVTTDTATVTATLGGFTSSTHPTAGKKIVFRIAFQLP